MQNMDHLKLELIAKIMAADEAETLMDVAAALDNEKGIGKSYSRDFTSALTTIRENVTLDDIFSEQNYQPVSFSDFQANVAQIEWHDSLEELLDRLD